DVGSESGTSFIAMEFIAGRPLSDYIAPGHFQNERRSVDVVRKLASALVEAHAKGIIHRDLKPANILVNERGEPILMDFGLARRADSARDGRATHAGMLIGSPAYMSPEQANGETDKIGPWSDLYSLGVLLFELLTNQLPFQGSVLTILSQIATKEPPLPSSLRPGLDPRLDLICRRMMAKRPRDRFASMSAVEQELTNWLRGSRTRESSDRSLTTSATTAPSSANESIAGLQLAPEK
ncbi:MAG: serine/threonine protein kinase, partial [Planctomycetaceae bacterium]|nr:serine/threonine protein kinase [Planctomycetaceae bacterium]